ncbi:MAG: hypothetical protein L0Y70_04835 [Gemmataceae bacterium]|nr:hypothetical protein [Gemmataceae bacterium]
MPLYWILAIVFGAGAIGGVVNAVITDNRFVFPKRAEGTTILRPGGIGNIFVSGIAASVSWGLYGPFAAMNLFGDTSSGATASLTLSGFVGAVLVEMGGARWLTSEVDKSLLREAGATAARNAKNQPLADAFAMSNAADVLGKAK